MSNQGKILKNALRGAGYTVENAAIELSNAGHKITRQTLSTYFGKAELDPEFLQNVKTILKVDIFSPEVIKSDKLQNVTPVGMIPYYENVDAICGDTDRVNMDYTAVPIFIPGARPGDFAVNAKGRSLAGIIESGTILGLRKVNDIDHGIIYGELYFVCTDSFERAKIIMPGTDKKHIVLKSTDDEKFPPVEIPKSKVTALYKVWYKGELL